MTHRHRPQQTTTIIRRMIGVEGVGRRSSAAPRPNGCCLRCSTTSGWRRAGRKTKSWANHDSRFAWLVAMIHRSTTLYNSRLRTVDEETTVVDEGPVVEGAVCLLPQCLAPPTHVLLELAHPLLPVLAPLRTLKMRSTRVTLSSRPVWRSFQPMPLRSHTTLHSNWSISAMSANCLTDSAHIPNVVMPASHISFDVHPKGGCKRLWCRPVLAARTAKRHTRQQ